jgi:glycosyltransferase involved in cell wall biosynthesis
VSPTSELRVVTPYGRGAGSSRVRVFSMVDRTRHRVDVDCYAGLPNARPSTLLRRPASLSRAERALRRPSSVPRVLLHREASPLSRGGLEQALLRKADLGVYELDDALFADTGAGGLARRLAPKAVKARVAATAADRVIAGNAVLAEWGAAFCRDVVVIPSCVDPADYDHKVDYQLSDPPRLGWIGSRDNERFLTLVGEALWEVHRQTGARLTLVGGSAPGLGPLEAIIDRIPWSEPAQRRALATFDVGIMPLPDDAYSRGKCAYKLLQYGAAGVPSVGSPVGVNREVLTRMALPAPSDPGEWAEAILSLLALPDEGRAAAGARAHQVATRDFSYDAWLGTWEAATGLATRSRRDPEVES